MAPGYPKPVAPPQDQNQPHSNTEQAANVGAEHAAAQARLASLQSQIPNPLALQNMNGVANAAGAQPLAMTANQTYNLMMRQQQQHQQGADAGAARPTSAIPANQAYNLALRQQHQQQQRQALVQLMRQQQIQQAGQSAPQNVANPPIAGPVEAPENQQVGPARAHGLSGQHSAQIQQAGLSVGQSSGQSQLVQQRLLAAAALGQRFQTLQSQQQQVKKKQSNAVAVPPPVARGDVQAQQGVDAIHASNEAGAAEGIPANLSPGIQQRRLSGRHALGTAAPTLQQQQQHQQALVQQVLEQQAELAVMQAQTLNAQQHEQQAADHPDKMKATQTNAQPQQQAATQHALLQAQRLNTQQKMNQLPATHQDPTTAESKQMGRAGPSSAAENSKQAPQRRSEGRDQVDMVTDRSQEETNTSDVVSERQKSLKLLVNTQKWADVLKRIKRDQSDVMIAGNATVLHGAIAKASWYVVKNLLALVPSLASVSCAVVPTQPPLVPIRMAISCAAPTHMEGEVFKIYVDAVDRIAMCDRSALSQRDEKGYTPLHSSIVSELPVLVSIVVLKAYPNAARTADTSGNLPLHSFLAAFCKGKKKDTAMSCQLLDKLLDAHPESLLMEVPAKTDDGSISPSLLTSAETIVKIHMNSANTSECASAMRVLLRHKAQLGGFQQQEGSGVGTEQGMPATRINTYPAPAIQRCSGASGSKAPTSPSASPAGQTKTSAQQGDTCRRLEEKKRNRELLQQEYDTMKHTAMTHIIGMQQQGIDIRKAIQSVNDPDSPSRSDSPTAAQAASSEKQSAAQYKDLLLEKEQLQKLVAAKDLSGKQIFEKLMSSRDASIKEKRDVYRQEVSRVEKKHQIDILNLRKAAEDKRKDTSARAAQLKKRKSESDPLQQQCNAAEEDVKQKRSALDLLQSEKKRKVQSLLAEHNKELKCDRGVFCNELSSLYNELDEKRQIGHEFQGMEEEAPPVKSGQDDSACTLIMQLREDISYMEGTVDALRQRETRAATEYKPSEIDEDELDEDEDVNVVDSDSDDESSQPAFPAANDEMENEFGIYERNP